MWKTLDLPGKDISGTRITKKNKKKKKKENRNRPANRQTNKLMDK